MGMSSPGMPIVRHFRARVDMRAVKAVFCAPQAARLRKTGENMLGLLKFDMGTFADSSRERSRRLGIVADITQTQNVNELEGIVMKMVRSHARNLRKTVSAPDTERG